MSIITRVVALPPRYRTTELFVFHGRDATHLAEETGPAHLRKGLVWRGQPACLTITFADDQARAELHVDGALAADDEAQLDQLLRRMLGLTQPIGRFEDDYRAHPQIGRLIARHPGLWLPVSASPFEALTWAVTGQQISVSAALSLRRKLIQTTDIRHSSGLYCHPDAAAVRALSVEHLRAASFSQTKAKTLHEICRRLDDGRLSLAAKAPSIPDLSAQLLAIPGVGPWTVSYALLRGYGWLDGSLHGDVAVRSSLQSLLGETEKVGEKEVERWLMPFSPWRALVAAHLWAWNSAAAY